MVPQGGGKSSVPAIKVLRVEHGAEARALKLKRERLGAGMGQTERAQIYAAQLCTNRAPRFKPQAQKACPPGP